jgi:hypothetical protein
MGLGTPNTVEMLQTSLQAKAKTEPAYRFYSLWDKVCAKMSLMKPTDVAVRMQVRQGRMGKFSIRSTLTEWIDG